MPDTAGGNSPRGELRPIPDPSVLTTEQLHREIGTLQKLLEMRDDALKVLVEEKFHTVDLQFKLIDDRTREQKNDTKAAVDAALTAQKEAIAKTETSTADQLRQLSAKFDANLVSLNVLLSDVKERVGKIESIKVGGNETRSAIYALAGFILALLAIGGFLAAAGGFGG